LATFHRSKSAI